MYPRREEEAERVAAAAAVVVVVVSGHAEQSHANSETASVKAGMRKCQTAGAGAVQCRCSPPQSLLPRSPHSRLRATRVSLSVWWVMYGKIIIMRRMLFGRERRTNTAS